MKALLDKKLLKQMIRSSSSRRKRHSKTVFAFGAAAIGSGGTIAS
jgi:hypothetical protein